MSDHVLRDLHVDVLLSVVDLEDEAYEAVEDCQCEYHYLHGQGGAWRRRRAVLGKNCSGSGLRFDGRSTLALGCADDGETVRNWSICSHSGSCNVIQSQEVFTTT